MYWNAVAVSPREARWWRKNKKTETSRQDNPARLNEVFFTGGGEGNVQEPYIAGLSLVTFGLRD
jgi:hypothetical protein